MCFSKRVNLIFLVFLRHMLKVSFNRETLLLKSWVLALIFMWSIILESSKIQKLSLKVVCMIAKVLSRETIFSLILFSLLIFLHLKKIVFMSISLHFTIFLAAFYFLTFPDILLLFNIYWIYFNLFNLSWSNLFSKFVATSFNFRAYW